MEVGTENGFYPGVFFLGRGHEKMILRLAGKGLKERSNNNIQLYK